MLLRTLFFCENSVVTHLKGFKHTPLHSDCSHHHLETFVITNYRSGLQCLNKLCVGNCYRLKPVTVCVEATCILMATWCWRPCPGPCDVANILPQHTFLLSYRIRIYLHRQNMMAERNVFDGNRSELDFHLIDKRHVFKLSFSSCWYLSINCKTILSHFVCILDIKRERVFRRRVVFCWACNCLFFLEAFLRTSGEAWDDFSAKS